MRNLSLILVALISVQMSVIAQINANNNSEDFKTTYSEFLDMKIISDTLIVLDSSLNFTYPAGVKTPGAKFIYKKRDSEGRSFININYLWDNLNDIYFMSTRDSILYYFDSKVKEKYVESFDRLSNSWRKKSYIYYNEKGKTLIDESLLWDGVIAQYYGGNQVIRTYFADTLLMKEETNVYDTATSDWRNKSKREYIRDDNGLIINDQSSVFDVILNSWVNTEMKEYWRDEKGNDTLIIKSSWNNELNNWTEEALFRRTFNNNSLLIETEYVWSDELNDWRYNYKTEQVYSEDGNLDTITRLKWYMEYGFWYGKTRQYRQYDNNILTLVVNQEYDLVYDTWYNSSRIIWEYVGGRKTMFLIDDWENNDWIGRSHQYLFYNQNGSLDSTSYKVIGTDELGWLVIYSTKVNYNQNGLRESLIEKQKFNSGLWEMKSETYYYYSTLILPNDINTYNNLEFKVYPNPSIGMFFLELPEDIALENTQLNVYDINGKLVKSFTYSNANQSIDLSGQTAGLYLINIKSETYSGFERIIIR